MCIQNTHKDRTRSAVTFDGLGRKKKAYRTYMKLHELSTSLLSSSEMWREKKRCGPRLQRAGVGRPFAGGGSVVGATSWPMAGPQSLSTGHLLHTGTIWDPGGTGGKCGSRRFWEFWWILMTFARMYIYIYIYINIYTQYSNQTLLGI